MGKKSKRQKGRKVDTNEVLLRKISNNIEKMAMFVYDSIKEKQYSEAASRERDIIEYVATQEEAMSKASVELAKDGKGEDHFATVLVERYRSLVFIEYLFRKKYDQVIEIHNEFTSKYADVLMLGAQLLEDIDGFNDSMKELQFFYELALVRTDRNLCNIPIINSFILRELRNKPTERGSVLWREQAIFALRASKEYFHAINLDAQLVMIPNRLSMFITYVERYRVEKHQSLPSAKFENYVIMIKLSNTGYDDHKGIEHKLVYSKTNQGLPHDYLLAMAQMCYLCHKLDIFYDEQDCIDKAILGVERLAHAKWMLRNKCSTCSQKPNTPSELQLVCSECQVSCYCGIDHQRISWMKNEVEGTRLAHKVFCPVLKAYRIWMEARDNVDEEREVRLERRFKKECISFLAYGLGLKDKCFESDDYERHKSSNDI